jgi:hypothetical protein
MSDGRIGVHPPVRASTDDRVVREAVADLLDVVQDESVSVCQPPVGVDPFGAARSRRASGLHR